MKISIVGTGYVGLVSGTCFAETGINVTCVDVNAEKIRKLNDGIIPIYEPGLDTIIERNVEKKRLKFTTDIAASLKECEVVFIAVGTPPDEDGSADLQHVLNVAKDVGKYMEEYLVVVTKSTVPVGTAEKVRKAVQQALNDRGVDIKFDVASNPEFLKEGAAVADFLKPDRIVIGLDSERVEEAMKRLYKPFLLNGHPIVFMDIPSAEMTKYTANAMLATKISFMNDIANLCEIVGADVNFVRKGIGSDTRIGSKFIYPGTGYGGSCFPKDVKALIRTAKENNYKLRVLQAVEEVNEDQKSILLNKATAYYNGNFKDKKFAIWGLSFKPETDDMREAPSLVVIDKLLKAGGKVFAYDPQAMEEAKHILEDKVELVKEPYEALIDADGLFIMTEWHEFRYPNFKVMHKLLKDKVIYDGRNIYEVKEMEEYGFNYFCIGKKTNRK